MEGKTKDKQRGLILKKRVLSDWASRDRLRLTEGVFGMLFSRLLPGVATRMKLKMKIASLWETCPVYAWIGCFLDRFLKTRVRATAVGMLCFGFLSTAFSLFGLFSQSLAADAAVMQIALGVAVVLGAVPLMLSRSLWHEAIGTSVLSSLWIHGLASYRREELEREGEYPQGGRFALLAGVALGLVSWWLSPLKIAVGVVLVVLVGQILYKPEFGLSLLVLLLGFLPVKLLLVLSLTVLLSFLFKWIRGKRVVRVEPADIFALLVFLLWASGIPFGLSEPAVVLLGAVIYFLLSKLVRTRSQAQRVFLLFVWELFFFGVLFFASKLFNGEFGFLTGELWQTLSVQLAFPSVSLDMVMMLLPLVAVAVPSNGAMRLLRFEALAMGLGILLFSGSPGAVFCLAISLLILAFLLGKRMLPLYVGLVAVAVAGFVGSPQRFYALFTDVPVLIGNAWMEQKEIIAAVLERDWLSVLFGAWTKESVALNSWGSFLYRFGLSGCLVLGTALVFFYRKCATVLFWSKHPMSSRLIWGMLLSVGVIFLRGITAGFADPGSVFGCFWMMCGLLCAVGDMEDTDRQFQRRKGDHAQ